MRYAQSRLLDPDGHELWSGPYGERLDSVRAAVGAASPAAVTLRAAAGEAGFPDGLPRPSDSEVASASERLGLVSRQRAPRGFFVLPPAGALFERCVEAFNVVQLDRLGATEIQLPAVYSAAEPELAELTAAYEADGRTFHLGRPRDDLRLTYAADPALFIWLKGRRLRSASMPFAIVSPMQIFRRYRSGELGPLGRTCQYALPDLHLLATPAGAEAACLAMVAANAEAMRFWLEDSFVQFVDVTGEFDSDHPGLAATMAREGRCFTLVNRFVEQPRYYRMRSGMMADAGTGALMLYNIQWDEQNPERFDLRFDAGGRPVILHGNALAGSGLLCVIVGRAVAGLSARRQLPELAPVSIHVQPAASDSVDFALACAERLAALGLRTRAEPAPAAGLGKALRLLRDDWAAAIAVVGPRERDGAELRIELGDGPPLRESEFLERHGPRIRRCTPLRPGPTMPLPFD